MKTFTLDEAQALLPLVESLLERATRARIDCSCMEAKLAELKVRIFYSGGLAVDSAAVSKEVAELAEKKKIVLEVGEEFESMGVQVKDLETGLLDFPCSMEGEIVLLCWKRGEARIEYWHTVDDGFAGRQRLDRRFERGSRANRPN